MSASGNHTTGMSNSKYLWLGHVCSSSIIERITRGTFARKNCAKKTVHSYERHPGQPSYLIKNGGNIECTTDNHIPMLVPRVQATQHQTKALSGRRESRHESRVGTQLPEWLNHSRKDWQGGSFKFERRGFQLTWPYHRQHFLLPRTPQQTSSKAGEKHHLTHTLNGRPKLRNMQTEI